MNFLCINIYTHFYLNVEQQIEYWENFFMEFDAATALLSVPGDTIGTDVILNFIFFVCNLWFYQPLEAFGSFL